MSACEDAAEELLLLRELEVSYAREVILPTTTANACREAGAYQVTNPVGVKTIAGARMTCLAMASTGHLAVIALDRPERGNHRISLWRMPKYMDTPPA